MSCKGPIYEYARQYKLPSVEWADLYQLLVPCSEYQMINGRIIVLHWDRPYMSVHGWDMDMLLPLLTRASFA